MKFMDFSEGNASKYNWNIVEAFRKKKEIGKVRVKEDWKVTSMEDMGGGVTQVVHKKGTVMPLYEDGKGTKIVLAITCLRDHKHWCLLEEAPVEVIR